ncbi:MAG: radical SAM protein [Proteobacteria bacterium]|nr:radical SAM protein [Pseudomonadota bacterium]MDA0951420.1 radical SAM protein [Pseudomonadota bacterium]
MAAVETTARALGKFADPEVTARGERRAGVRLDRLDTLWINTGTLCNLTCAGCYIESSPRNDRLVYITAAEVAAYLDEIERDALGTREIGFTGGEPFINPDFLAMVGDALGRGFRVLILTNAMRPMMKCADGLLDLQRRFGERLVLRVSVDHYAKTRHQLERGARSWDPMIRGLRWLAEHGFTVHVAGRTRWAEDEASLRDGFRALFAQLGVAADADDPMELVLFPEMDEKAEVPEITEACWGILHVEPSSMMCAGSRMVVKRKGAQRPAVVACTLLPYDPRFEMGTTLAEAAGEVKLNHPHCAKFCVLGGGSCSKA